MKVFDDIVVLEFQKEEWEQEKAKSKIFIPDTIRERTEGKEQEMCPPHFFKVVEVGPNCTKVKIGDRVFPKPPSLQNPARFIGIRVYIDGKLEPRHIIREEDIAGVE
jgi:hypothetical protein